MAKGGLFACLAACLLLAVPLHLAFTSAGRPASRVGDAKSAASATMTQPMDSLEGGPATLELQDTAYVSPWELASRIMVGFCVGAFLVFSFVLPARADEFSDTAIPIDGQGKTVILTKEEVIRGKRLFLNACSICHVGGGTRTNQNVGLGYEELSGAQPPRNTVNALVEYLNAPTTYDGLKDISEVHPSIKAADVWPKMATMKQKDLYDISTYILYQNFTIPEKWGGGKQYY